MSTRVINYDFGEDHFAERIKRYERLGYGDFETLQEAIKARRKYLGEIADRLRAVELLFARADGTEKMVSVRGSEEEEFLNDLEEMDDEDDEDIEDDNKDIIQKIIELLHRIS
jgi:hypothetical protein